MTAIKAVAVYCGALHGAEPKYRDAAYEFGRQLAQSNIDLVFGGGSVGLMGVVSQGVADAGGRAIGVITRLLVRREAANGHLSRLEVVESMHERKQLMFAKSDAFVALPGGLGTLEEFVEQLTWSQLGRHSKPIVLANIDGFWDPLLVLFDKMDAERFIRPGLDLYLLVVNRIEDIIPVIDKALVPYPEVSEAQAEAEVSAKF